MNRPHRGHQILKRSHEMIGTIIFSFYRICHSDWEWLDFMSIWDCMGIFEVYLSIFFNWTVSCFQVCWGRCESNLECEKNDVNIATVPNTKYPDSHNRETNHWQRRSLSTVRFLLQPHSWGPTLGPLYSHLFLNCISFCFCLFLIKMKISVMVFKWKGRTAVHII